jgi:hypothetical protein
VLHIQGGGLLVQVNQFSKGFVIQPRAERLESHNSISSHLEVVLKSSLSVFRVGPVTVFVDDQWFGVVVAPKTDIAEQL